MYKVNNIIQHCKYSLNRISRTHNKFIIYTCKICQKRIFAINYEIKFSSFYIIINIAFDKECDKV